MRHHGGIELANWRSHGDAGGFDDAGTGKFSSPVTDNKQAVSSFT